ncbi:S-type pyocin domain-containing protein [Pseudomonas coleopterorum]|uniref:S-type pyocin domain-containing protein n=1 Tax=Pseudomonas coleopterorum TaxID=1605838 RepID=UPI002A6A3DF9|nr:S-type pyocin domain-containing protein [Pseudomonas coleopterorum]MDY1017100.1 S-type pyocin domain-containing protein [Pseudomonas coleopterorum]
MTQWKPGDPVVLDPLVITPDPINIPPLDLQGFNGPGLYGDGHNFSLQTPGIPLDYLGQIKNLSSAIHSRLRINSAPTQIELALRYEAAFKSMQVNHPNLSAMIPTRTQLRVRALLEERLPNGAGRESHLIEAQLAILQQLIADNAAQRDQQLAIAEGTSALGSDKDAVAHMMRRTNEVTHPSYRGDNLARPFFEREISRLSAAFSARLLTEAISYIEGLQPGLREHLANVQRAEQQAEEAARLLAQQQAEEAARQLAQQQAEEAARLLAQQQAEEAARQLAQQQAEEAARLLAQQQAEEAARLLAQQQAEEAARLLAQQQAEEAARLLAQQQAEEAARLELEAQRIRNGYAMPDTTSLAAFSAMGGAAIVVGEASLNALQTAIRTATAGLATAAVGTSAMLASVVGALTLLWPASVGDSERRLSLSVPLKDLSPPEGVDWAALAAQGGSVDLPYVMLNETHGDQTKIVVAKSDGALIPSKVRVVAAQLDAVQNLYTVQLDSPPRTLVWRPLKDPGTDTSSSTALPSDPSKPAIYSGATLEVIEPHIESYPALDGLGVEQIIVDFPIDSGLDRVLIMFKDRRLEPGVATGNGGDIEKLWLGEQSRGLGAAIPTRIADQLRDKEFRTFNQFREEFWKTVARDVELSTQFSKGNLSGMTKDGYAPNVRTIDQHKSLDTYVLHHRVPISEGGGVYDIDNIRIVTPKAHHAIHYKEGK